MADDFDAYLDTLNGAEVESARKALERSRQEAIVNYTDWARHFELVRRNFTAAEGLFGTIAGKVMNWKINPSYLMSSDAEGYQFECGIYRKDMYTEETDKRLMVSCARLGDERTLRFEYPIMNSDVPHDLVGLENLDQKLLTAKRTEPLIAKLSEADIRFKLFTRGNAQQTYRYAKLGFLYEHNLADTCKAIFKMMNSADPSAWESGLGLIIPVGDYSIRRGNMMSRTDDNNLPQDIDPKWRNG
jgi:hypothetical protein